LYHSDSESRRPENRWQSKWRETRFYRDGIASVVRRRQQSDLNLYFLNGLTLIDDQLFLLVTDNVHPNDAGMHRIAQGVAAALKPILAPVG
jgi:lysophospholipase L1-like esterase